MKEAIEAGQRASQEAERLKKKEEKKNKSNTERREDGQRSGWTMGSVAELRPACCCLERNRPCRAFQRRSPTAETGPSLSVTIEGKRRRREEVDEAEATCASKRVEGVRGGGERSETQDGAATS